MRVMKTNAFLKMKLEKHCFFPLTYNSNSGFQKDVLELGFCQASSKVFYLTRRGYGRDLSTRCTFKRKKKNWIPSQTYENFLWKIKSTRSLGSQEITLVLFILRFVWGQWPTEATTSLLKMIPWPLLLLSPGSVWHFSIPAQEVTGLSKSCQFHCPL